VALKLRTAADGWIGTPYRYGGRTREGIDCSALACRLLQEVGVSLPRTVRDQRRVGRPVERRRLAPGDLLFFRLGSSGVNHVGVALGGGRFAHASRSRGVVVEDIETAYYAQRLTEARRVLDSSARRE
jgi:cell wall-associated NlpC family hydrolase